MDSESAQNPSEDDENPNNSSTDLRRIQVKLFPNVRNANKGTIPTYMDLDTNVLEGDFNQKEFHTRNHDFLNGFRMDYNGNSCAVQQSAAEIAPCTIFCDLKGNIFRRAPQEPAREPAEIAPEPGEFPFETVNPEARFMQIFHANPCFFWYNTVQSFAIQNPFGKANRIIQRTLTETVVSLPKEFYSLTFDKTFDYRFPNSAHYEEKPWKFEEKLPEQKEVEEVPKEEYAQSEENVRVNAGILPFLTLPWNELNPEELITRMDFVENVQSPKASEKLTKIEEKPVFEKPKGVEKTFCKLCRKNGEPSKVYLSHNVKSRDGRVTCPILQKYVCSLCGATGEFGHTKKHCPLYENIENIPPQKQKPKIRILSNGKPTKQFNHK